MMDLDIDFEDSPWQQMLDRLQMGDSLSALSFLPLIEDEDEDTILEALDSLNGKKIRLDISALPTDLGSGQQSLRLKMEQDLAKQPDLRQGLDKTDPLRLYLEELAGTPCAGQEDQLLHRLAEGDENAAGQLLTEKLSLVVELAREYTGKGVLLMDLIQEGSLGLWQGIHEYRQGSFTEHCRWWIHQFMARAVLMQARSGGIGRKLREGMEDYRDVDSRLLTELGRNPTLEEIADGMHITPDEASTYAAMIEQARNRQMVDKALAPKEEKDSMEEDNQAVEDTAYFHQRQRIMELLSVLPELDAKLLSLRFGLEGGVPLSPQDTGEKLGLTPQEVVEREASALAKLRQQD